MQDSAHNIAGNKRVAVSEIERERLYWWASLLLCLVSPLIVGMLVRSDISFAGFAFMQARFFVVSIAGLVAANLLEFVFAKLRGVPLGIFITNLTIDYETRSDHDPLVTAQKMVQTLAVLGFTIHTGPDARTIRFEKAAKQKVHAFLDHAFSGTVAIEPLPRGTQLGVTLTFKDTILIETGERANLFALAGEICGQPAAHDFTNVPFTVYFGFALCFLTLLLSGFVALRTLNLGWLIASSVLAAGVNLTGVALICRNRKQHFGLRVAVAGLYLASTPYWALLIASSLRR